MKWKWVKANLRRAVHPATRAGWRYFVKAAFLREHPDGSWSLF